ncbi:hypothetical protein [Mariniplasma anaerobium]|uniref:Uncharacterized protein n=1 Tax=Mariniplasma anaerobium TaxID=2735436 RepID=A0A7U9XWI0_9MOLU|nr:hypothetical protein [Mariniplasma anaerobium]BCR36028.1 hypothetical protein MPAN_009210 [Mariniplasma anaerobium]
MKSRLIIALSLTTLVLILLPIALILLGLRGQGIFMISAIISLVYIGVYVFGGIPKLIITSIYGILVFTILRILPYDYQFPFIIIGTLLFILNPLSIFEQFLENKMKDEAVLPIRIRLSGSYWPFFEYRKEMKNFYHLPQQRKLYTKKWYLHTRQAVMLFLYTLGIFLFIHEINFVANSLNDFSWSNFFTLYIVIIVFLLAYFVHSKGFTSTFRILSVAIFPPIIYLTLISRFDDALRYSLAGSTVLFGLVIVAIELHNLYQRVAYDKYEYYDVDQQLEVRANALFEPLVYNETFTLSGHYHIKVSRKKFKQYFHDVLVYANFFHFIISAYAYEGDIVHLYTEFNKKAERRACKFKTYLEAKYKTDIPMDLKHDPDKTIYETNFFHRPEYIIARAQRLAELLKELHIDAPIIISIIAYFNNYDDLKYMKNEYHVTLIESIKVDDYITARIDLTTVNNDYLIETKIRDVLLSLMVYRGKYVRVSVYY